tara:strand:+ start:67 stop:1116 length:1050 start_codon:yes stop_codon:yes gene_type:complete
VAGILDKKTRFIDLVLTQEGKRQLANGKLRAEYASLTDRHTFYEKSQHENVKDRLYFQVMERPENMIVLEKDDSGRLIDFNFSPTGSIVGNDIFDKDAKVNNKLVLNAVTGSAFASTSSKLMKSFLRHFQNNSLVGTYFVNGSNQFELSKKDLRFTISNSVPFPELPKNQTVNVNDADPFFFDSKLSHMPNFKFLPPVNTDMSPYGQYQNLQSKKKETLSQIKKSLGVGTFDEENVTIEDNDSGARQDKLGDFSVINRKKLNPTSSPVTKQFETVNFKKTSRENNLLIQFFEDSRGAKLTKLDVIDAGVFYDADARLGREQKQIYYVGKIYIDDFNTPTFINMFTMVFD